MEFFPTEPLAGRHGGVEATVAIGSGGAIPPAEVTVKVGVAALEERIKTLEAAETDAREHSRQRDDRDRGNQEVLNNLRRDLAQQEAQAAVIDARGLPIAFLGALLGGLPAQLAAWPFVSGILWMMGLIAVVFVVVQGIRYRRRNESSPRNPVSDV